MRSRSLLLLVPFVASCATARTRENRLLEVVEAAARGSAAVDTVWPGYRPFERGFIVFEPGGSAYLVADAEPGPDWVTVASDEVGLRGRLHRRSTALPGLTGGINVAYRVGEHTYPAIEVGDDVKSTLVTLYHEAFHEWQDSTFVGLLAEHLPAVAVAPEQVAAIELERRILADAIDATPGPSTDSLIAAFLAVRHDRMASLPDSARAVDRSLERHEGLANLVGYQGAAAALDLDAHRVQRPVVDMLKANLARFGADHAARYYRWRAYGTGAAMGVLLDRLGVAWRADAAAGTALDSLLLTAARMPPSPVLHAAARARFGYEELLRAAEAGAAPTSADPLADFLALAPHRLVVEIAVAGAFEANMSFNPGDAGFATPLPSVTLMPEVARASMTAPAFDLSVTGRSVMMDGRDPSSLRVVVLLPFAPRVDGRPASRLVGPSAGEILISGADTELVVRGEHLLGIEVAPGIVTVRVRAD